MEQIYIYFFSRRPLYLKQIGIFQEGTPRRTDISLIALIGCFRSHLKAYCIDNITNSTFLKDNKEDKVLKFTNANKGEAKDVERKSGFYLSFKDDKKFIMTLKKYKK